MTKSRNWLRSLGSGWIAACVLASSAAAQTKAMPPQPTNPDGPQPAGGAPGEGTDPSRGWIYSVALGLGWESNVGLKPSPTQSDFGVVAHAAAGRSVKTPKGDFNVSANALGYIYNEETQNNSLNGDVRLHGERRLAPTTTGGFDLSVASDQSYNVGILLDQGVLLPATRTFSYSATLEAAHQFSELTSVRTVVLGDRVSFPDSPLLRTSHRLRMSAELDRRVSEQNNLVLEYAAELADSAAPGQGTEAAATSWWTHYLSGQWRRRLSPRSTFQLEAGASYTPEGIEAGLPKQASFFGGAGLDYSTKRTSMAVYYRREVLPVFGTGELHLTDRVGLNLYLAAGQRWVSTIGSSYSTAVMGQDGERRSSIDAYANGALRVSGRWWLNAIGRYLNHSAVGSSPELEDFRAAALVVLATPGSAPLVAPWR